MRDQIRTEGLFIMWGSYYSNFYLPSLVLAYQCISQSNRKCCQGQFTWPSNPQGKTSGGSWDVWQLGVCTQDQTVRLLCSWSSPEPTCFQMWGWLWNACPCRPEAARLGKVTGSKANKRAWWMGAKHDGCALFAWIKRSQFNPPFCRSYILILR